MKMLKQKSHRYFHSSIIFVMPLLFPQFILVVGGFVPFSPLTAHLYDAPSKQTSPPVTVIATFTDDGKRFGICKGRRIPSAFSDVAAER